MYQSNAFSRPSTCSNHNDSNKRHNKRLKEAVKMLKEEGSMQINMDLAEQDTRDGPIIYGRHIHTKLRRNIFHGHPGHPGQNMTEEMVLHKEHAPCCGVIQFY